VWVKGSPADYYLANRPQGNAHYVALDHRPAGRTFSRPKALCEDLQGKSGFKGIHQGGVQIKKEDMQEEQIPKKKSGKIG
jgi:hypothetical protein